tara:strand:+ start:65 stop:778 length:714 start_codon:yes stop_codon:yes gene_type:complete
MDKVKKVKIIMGAVYLIILCTFLYFLFHNFKFEDISSIKVIHSNQDQLNILKEKNLILLIAIFFLLTVLWVILLGFGSPVALIGGFIFGKWIGTIVVTISLSVGALCLYIFAKFFLYDFLKEKLFVKFKKLYLMFQKKQLLVMIIFRFIGMVPFFLANLLPVIFNINKKNYFLGTVIGIMPAIFIMVSLGSGINEAIYSFEKFPSLLSLISLPGIYFPISGFFILLILSILLKGKFK